MKLNIGIPVLYSVQTVVGGGWKDVRFFYKYKPAYSHTIGVVAILRKDNMILKFFCSLFIFQVVCDVTFKYLQNAPFKTILSL